MIEEIRIADLGVISAARLAPGRGMTAITGETGAGKTMLLTGLEMLLGGKPDGAIVRSGAERALVEGTFLLPEGGAARQRAEAAGAELDEDALLLARTQPAEGRSRAFAGGRSVPRGVLREIGEELITVHGQSSQLRLRNPAHQREVLDTYAGEEHLATLHAYRATWQELQAAAEELAAWQQRGEQRQAEISRLTTDLELLHNLDAQRGEDAELREEAERLANVEDRREAATLAHTALSATTQELGETDATVLVAEAQRALSGDDRLLDGLGQRLGEVAGELADVTTELATYLEDLAADPQRLQSVHERRAALSETTRRLALTDPEELPRYAERAAARLADLNAPGETHDTMQQREEELRHQLTQLGEAISATRQRAAVMLAEAVDSELSALAMPGARLEVHLPPRPELGPWGAEDVSIELAAHPTSPAQPLGEGASGGELSRVMLAIEVALAEVHDEGGRLTFVFDEVDAGIGGKAALEVGRRLSQLARNSQVLVVTHLAQVAAFADTQLLVARGSDEETLQTDVEEITGADREQELARMLSGQEESEVARRHAAELVELAGMAR